MAKAVSPSLRLPAISVRSASPLLLNPTLSHAAAGDKYALVDHANNIVLQQEFADHSPIPRSGTEVGSAGFTSRSERAPSSDLTGS
jgi:hypothetical protein